MQREYWFIAIAAILYGTLTVGGQFFLNLGLSVYEIALYSMFFMGLLLLPIVLIKREYLIKKEMFLFFVIFGLINALQELTQFRALALGIPVAIVAFLLYSQPSHQQITFLNCCYLLMLLNVHQPIISSQLCHISVMQGRTERINPVLP